MGDVIRFPFSNEEIERELARREFREFVAYTKQDYEFNWHHEIFCQKLHDFAHKKIKRLMIFVPPRHGKSELASRRLPAYIFGMNPKARIIAAAYGADLATSFNRDVQRIMDTPEYLTLFPHARLPGANARSNAKTKWLRNSDMFEIVDFGGSYVCAGVGGAINGKGGDYLLLDDPYKSAKEADSPTVRKTVWEWYTSTFYTRQEKDASILIIQTRWHDSDVSGALLELQKLGEENADKWEVVSMPAIMDDEHFMQSAYDDRAIGEALWPNKYPISFLNKTKVALGTRQFSALYQQNPKPGDGSIIKSFWFKFYDNKKNPKPDRFDRIIMSWDMTFGDSENSDYVVGGVYGQLGADFYLLDQVRGQMDLPATIKAFKALAQKWPTAITKLIEKKANGQAVYDSIKKEISGVILINPTESKISRVNACAPLYEAGNVWYPSPEICTWIGDHIEELTTFPLGKKDDRVDSESQALNYLRNTGGDTMPQEASQTSGGSYERVGDW